MIQIHCEDIAGSRSQPPKAPGTSKALSGSNVIAGCSSSLLVLGLSLILALCSKNFPDMYFLNVMFNEDFESLTRPNSALKCHLKSANQGKLLKISKEFGLPKVIIFQLDILYLELCKCFEIMVLFHLQAANHQQQLNACLTET